MKKSQIQFHKFLLSDMETLTQTAVVELLGGHKDISSCADEPTDMNKKCVIVKVMALKAVYLYKWKIKQKININFAALGGFTGPCLVEWERVNS